MSDYYNAAMRLYVDRMVDWGELLRLRKGGAVDAGAEVDSYRTVLETVAALCESFERPARENWHAEAELAEDGTARPPAHIRAAYEQLREAGLVCLPVSEEYGGPGLPALVNGLYLEMVSRADTSLMTVVGLQAGAAGDVEHFGTEELKRTYLPRFTTGELQGCMDLTEPQAGSDLGGIATKATEQGDGRLLVDGTKIFITNGGADIHLVLVRDADTFEESKGTTNGLSLVLVPTRLPDGSRNGVRVSRLEHKLGIHGSPTCEVVFEGATGWRLGEKGKGFRAMLNLMNNARLGVAAQAMGLSEAALSAAVAYAGERRQFGKPIAEQPLVLTMLGKMAVNVEAARALLYRTFEILDLNLAREAALARNDLSEEERTRLAKDVERDSVRVRLLTPLCKYFATEISDDVTRDAMQVFGGIGYTMDYDVAKLHADSLIMTVYEGTSEIQASFALREMGKGALAVVLSQIRSELAAMADDPKRGPLAKQVEKTIVRVEESAKTLFADIAYALLRAKMMAEMVINLIASTELLRQAGADPARIDLAEAFVRRRMVETESMARRIEENHAGRLERDARILQALARSGA